MPNSKPEKIDRDAFAGVSYGCVHQAQDACGMTDCGQSSMGEAGDRAVLEKTTARPTTATHPDDLDARQPEQTIEAYAQMVS